jgi:pseudouridine-5'-monophosphatase
MGTVKVSDSMPSSQDRHAATFLPERREPLETLMRTAKPMPGATELVSDLADRGVPMAVATSSDRALFLLKTATHAWFSHFRAVVCADDVLQLKPAPDLFLAAAERMGANPRRCLVFEDSPAGIEAAKRANMRVIGLADARTGAEAVVSAHVVIESFCSLPAWRHLLPR